MAEKWIQKAVSKHPGAFSAKAKAAGKSTAQYASEKAHAPGRLGRQARLARTLMKMEGGGVVDTAPAQRGNLSRLYDILFGRKALQQASSTGDSTPAYQSQPQSDVSAIRQAAQEAAERMRRAKEENKGVAPKEFACGGMVSRYGKYGKR